MHTVFFLFYFVTIVTFLICARLSYKRTYIIIINIFFIIMRASKNF